MNSSVKHLKSLSICDRKNIKAKVEIEVKAQALLASNFDSLEKKKVVDAG